MGQVTLRRAKCLHSSRTTSLERLAPSFERLLWPEDTLQPSQEGDQLAGELIIEDRLVVRSQ